MEAATTIVAGPVGFSDVVDGDGFIEIGQARGTWSTLASYQGIHFRFADATARREGECVANWAFEHFLRPIDDNDRHGHDDQLETCGN